MSQVKIVYGIPKWFKEKREMKSYTQKEWSKDEKIRFAQSEIFDYQYDDEYANRLVYYRIVVLGERVFIYEQKRGKMWEEEEEE